jgi:Cu/Zn superoxide dismutase
MNVQKIVSAVITASALGFVALSINHANAQTMKSDTMGMLEKTVKLISVGAPTTGSVEIVKQSDGSRIVRLQNLKTEAGPDLHVYLYAAAVPSKTAKDVKNVKFVDLGKLGAPFKGNFQYKIPANTKLESFKSLIVWCDVAKVTFAGAKLN